MKTSVLFHPCSCIFLFSLQKGEHVLVTMPLHRLVSGVQIWCRATPFAESSPQLISDWSWMVLQGGCWRSGMHIAALFLYGFIQFYSVVWKSSTNKIKSPSCSTSIPLNQNMLIISLRTAGVDLLKNDKSMEFKLWNVGLDDVGRTICRALPVRAKAKSHEKPL